MPGSEAKGGLAGSEARGKAISTKLRPSDSALPVFADFSGSSDEELDDTPPEFYDPMMDDRDLAWAERKRQGRKSDALLSCPACFTTLCIDCQRHEKIVTQYRAMFVLNCKILEGQSSHCSLKKRKRRARKPSFHEAESTSTSEMYLPVACSICGTEVAVLDKDEVYHFYDVLPSFV